MSCPPLPLYFISLGLTIIFAPLLFTVPINLMAPAIVVLIQRFNQLRCLKFALITGIIIDLLSGYNQLGHFAASYSITTLILYRYRHRVFHDTVWALPLMTYIFSATLELSSALLNNPGKIHFSWFVTEILLIPLLSACYAFALFPTVTFLLNYRKKDSTQSLASRPQ